MFLRFPHPFSSLLSTPSDSSGMYSTSLLSHPQILHVKIIIFHYSQGDLFEGHTFSRLHSAQNCSMADRRMDKEDVVHIYNGISLSHKKKQNWVICRDVDVARDCHTE